MGSVEAVRLKPRRVLCLGAHCDDIEIGCGGSVLKLIADSGGATEIHWVVFSAPPARRREAERSAKLFLKDAKRSVVVFGEFRDSYLPFAGAEVKAFMHEVSRQFEPDLIFTHCRHDLHQDHRLLCELTWNAFRNHTILEYEIPKYDGDLGAPNMFIPLTRAQSQRKIRAILSSFKTQRNKQWFTEDTFWALLRLRGVECNAPGKYAEAFHCRKMLLI